MKDVGTVEECCIVEDRFLTFLTKNCALTSKKLENDKKVEKAYFSPKKFGNGKKVEKGQKS